MDNVDLAKKDLTGYSFPDLRRMSRNLDCPFVREKEDQAEIVAQALYEGPTAVPEKNPTLYLVAGSPGAGKTTIVNYLLREGIVPHNVIICDRDEIMLQLHPEVKEETIWLKHLHPELIGQKNEPRWIYETSSYMGPKYGSQQTGTAYENCIQEARRKNKSLMTFVPPFQYNPKHFRNSDNSNNFRNYNLKIIYVHTCPETSMKRVEKRSADKPWLHLNTASIWCGLEEALNLINEYCGDFSEASECIICDNEGPEPICYTWKEFYELPSFWPEGIPKKDQKCSMTQLPRLDYVSSKCIAEKDRIHNILNDFKIGSDDGSDIDSDVDSDDGSDDGSDIEYEVEYAADPAVDSDYEEYHEYSEQDDTYVTDPYAGVTMNALTTDFTADPYAGKLSQLQ